WAFVKDEFAFCGVFVERFPENVVLFPKFQYLLFPLRGLAFLRRLFHSCHPSRKSLMRNRRREFSGACRDPFFLLPDRCHEYHRVGGKSRENSGALSSRITS